MLLQNAGIQNKRLLGIDLFRGIAAFGVVVIHGLGEIPRDEEALALSNFFVIFCVPFFLITSFYFSSNLLLSKNTKAYLNNRTKRIIFPYLAWTIIYLLARFIGSLIGNQESFHRLVADPINIIFFGASGVQLYFLPMLLCGSLAVILTTKILKNIQNYFLLIFCFLLSIYIFDLMSTTGNDFVLGKGIAFKQIIDTSSFTNLWLFQFMRLILVILSWSIKCIPYIIFSIIINKHQSQKILYKYMLVDPKNLSIKLLLWLFVPLFIGLILLSKIHLLYLLLPYMLFIYAILISRLISQNTLISSIANKLGYFSFGIYLSHALITAGFLPIMVKLYPKIWAFELSPLTLIIFSMIIFFISLIITHLISLNKTAARFLLAI
ncbi:acyltransferase family protein [Halotia branconii]|uniref:Acyltransferase family protein n=1 Tax=Halotia branconii CENA392 TaxID=1539056 RepID=A0AAJ6NYR7_9CYAN|nr:acyltransferase family protein [Halotia branconii]WGV29224.1 acyltransferase family protein [Halotia branconii CENA392]